MSILILNFVSHERCPYEKFLKECGEDLILFTSDEYAADFCAGDYLYIESFENYRNNHLVEFRALEIYQQYQFHTIIANAEADIVRAAKLRERLQIHGQTVQSAIQYRDKVLMKQLASQHGIPTPPFSAIDDSFDLIQFIEQVGFPVVLKPRSGVGSRDTYIINHEGDFRNILKAGVPSSYIAEQFVPGNVCHVDGVVRNGEVVFSCASKYLNEPIHYHQKGYLGSYVLDFSDPLASRLISMTKKCLSALTTPENTTFHAEWFHTPDDRLVLCEIASRTGGGKIVDNVYHSFGVHLDQAFVQSQCQLPTTFLDDTPTTHLRTGWVKIPPKQGVFVAAPLAQLPDWVLDYQLLAQPGQNYASPNGVREYVASFIVEGSSDEDIYNKLLSIADWFHQTSSWQDSDLIAT